MRGVYQHVRIRNYDSSDDKDKQRIELLEKQVDNLNTRVDLLSKIVIKYQEAFSIILHNE